jgi:hypothetical protein
VILSHGNFVVRAGRVVSPSLPVPAQLVNKDSEIKINDFDGPSHCLPSDALPLSQQGLRKTDNPPITYFKIVEVEALIERRFVLDKLLPCLLLGRLLDRLFGDGRDIDYDKDKG